jgi:hypothetical protein
MYVSESRLDGSEAANEVDDIVSRSITKNRKLNITGALVFTGKYFAQALEGGARDVEALMAEIRCDVRHCNVTVVASTEIIKRRFSNWQMAYQGCSAFVERPLRELMGPLPPGHTIHRVSDIYDLMREFTSN